MMLAHALALGAGGRVRPFSPDALGSALLGYWDTADAVGSPVSALSGYGGTLRQATAANQPTLSAGRLNFDGTNDLLTQHLNATLRSAVNLPDASNGDTGKGFTCTGLTQAPDGTWWVANDGRDQESGGNGLQVPSLVHLSADFTTKLGEILCSSIDAGITGSIQGIAYDTSDDTLWFVSQADSKVWHVGTNGSVIGSLALAFPPNALAIDGANLIVGHASTSGSFTRAEWVNKSTGATAKSILLLYSNPDHFHFDASDGSQGALWASWGTNNVPGIVAKFDVATAQATGFWSLAEADAIEGIHVTGSTLSVLSDGYFHGAASALNRALTYDIALPGSTTSTLALFGVAQLNASPSATKGLLCVNDPVGGQGAGVMFPGSTTTSLRLSVKGVNVDFAVTTTTEFLFYALIDTSADTATLWVNGVQIGAPQSVAAVSGDLRAAAVVLGAADETPVARWANCKAGAAGAATTSASRQQIEGHMAWRLGLTALLPSDHPYKSNRP